VKGGFFHCFFFNSNSKEKTSTKNEGMVQPPVFGASSTAAAAPRVRSMLLLDSEGKRIAVKYYTGDM
jgi:hypothetical protein